MRVPSPLALVTAAAVGLSSLIAPVSAPEVSAAPAGQIVDSPIVGVYDTAVGSDGTTYAVGDFVQVGAATGGLALLDGTTAVVNRTFPAVNGNVNAVVSDPSGAIYLGGDFVAVGGVPRANLARILPDGQVDPNWDTGITGTYASVRTLLLRDGTLFVGGRFDAIGGEALGNLAALSAETGDVLPWAADVTRVNYAPEVRALASDDTHLYVAGNFTSIGGVSQANLAALELGDLSVDSAWNPLLAEPVHTLAADGRLVYLGGYFASVDGDGSRSLIAAVDAVTGDLSPTWDPDVQGSSVEVITVDDTTVYFGGNFTQVNILTNPTSRRNAAAVSADDTGSVTPWDPSLIGLPTAIAVTPTHVYVGGNFYAVGLAQTPWRVLARFDKSAGLVDMTWNPRAQEFGGPNVLAILTRGDGVVAAGSFTHMNAIERNYAAAFDTGMRVTNWDPNLDDAAYAIGIRDSLAYIFGDFTHVRGEPRSRAAAVGIADNGIVSPWDPQLDDPAYAVDIEGSIAYIVGDFDAVNGGERRQGAAALNLDDTGSATDFDPDIPGSVYGIDVEGDTAYVVGSFSEVNELWLEGPVTRNNSAAFDSETGLVTPWEPDLSGDGADIVVSDGIAYVAGDFDDVNHGSEPRAKAAAFRTDDTGLATDWNPDLDGAAYDIAVYGSQAYLAGDFEQVNGGTASRGGLAAFDVATGAVNNQWIPIAHDGFNYGASYEGSLTATDSRLLVGGAFTLATLDGVDYPGSMAALPIPGGPVPPAPLPVAGVEPGAPREVTVMAGQAQLDVAWMPPASPGSFPVSHYRVSAQPGAHACLSTGQSCRLTDLVNGVEYAVSVQALNGAGWGAASDSVYAVPGRAAGIQITGSRDGRLIRVEGTSTGLGMGAILRPWIRKPGGTFTEGTAEILVDMHGDFAWQRRSSSRLRVYVETPDGSLRSNALTIPSAAG